MQEPNWTNLLSELYSREEPIKIPLQEESYDVSMEDIQNENLKDFQQKELETSIDFLTENGMIEYHYDGKENRNDSPDYQVLQITTKGFDVAHEREISQTNQRINTSLIYLTAILALTAAIQALSSILTLDGPDRTYMLIGSGVAILFFFIFILHTLYNSVW